VADRIAREVVVSGRVQGVYFRDSTRQAARSAGVVGWVRNEPDGTVHAHLEGSPEAVDEVVAFMGSGPPEAEVADVTVTDVEPRNLPDFALD
jgi:acylphosphatase